MKEFFITTPDKKRIAVYESNGSGQTVLFVYGNSLGAELFSKQFNSELGKKYRLIAFDFSGHGNSDVPSNTQETYSVKGLVDCLLYVIETLKLKEPLLVGHSLGGHIIIEAAEHITDTKGYVIFGTPPIGIPPDMAQAYLPFPALGLAFTPDLSDDDITTLANAFVADNYSDIAPIKQLIKNTDKNFRSIFPASVLSGGMKDEVKIVSSLNKPLAIFHGEQEKLVNINYLQSLYIPSLWQNKIHLIPNAGHCPQWENAEEFNNLLEKFISFL